MKRIALVVALVAGIIAVGVAGYRVAFRESAQQRTWIVSSFSGGVQVRVQGGEWTDVTLKTPLTDGDRLRTGQDGEATLLRDDDQVTLRAASELEISQLNDDASRFQVAIGQVDVEARGTSLTLDSESGARLDATDARVGMTVRADGWTQVKVKRGTAAFSSAGQTEHLKEGELSKADAGKPPSKAAPIPESILLNVRFPDQETFNVQLARVEGKADPGARVKVDGRTVAVSEDGAWTAEVALAEGVNEIEVEATDAFGATQTERSGPLRVDTTAPGLSGAAFGARAVAPGR